MNLTLQGVLDALKLAGTDSPAFRALFDQVKRTFSTSDQATLQAAYEEARKRSDAAHTGLQDEGGAGR